jgi:alanine racemase
MSRAAAYVNLAAIAQNISFIKEKTNKPLLAVVKADAYGHGLIPVAKAAKSAGAEWLGTALLEEALALRAANISGPIIAWLTPLGEDFESALRNQIDLSVSSVELLNEIMKVARQLKIKPRLHVELDTGMTRGGVRNDLEKLISELIKVKNEFEFIGLWTHFARADEPAEQFTQLQIKKFLKMSDAFNSVGLIPELKHLSNSAASINFADVTQDLIRWGIGMYGLSPDVVNMGDSKKLLLKPAMKLTCKLHLVKSVEAGAQVGYGGLGKVDRDTKIAIVNMGYADGIPRISSNKAGVFIENKRAPLLGRVSMDQFVVDLGINSKAKTGDEVIVFGDGAAGEYTVDDWAAAAGTINYEIVTRIGVRVPRIYVHE